ncbi:MAG: type II secretion system protein GspG [Actinomycetota bacterium]|nr:type II secretion system protein GspG [Actinomycetota bacterium]
MNIIVTNKDKHINKFYPMFTGRLNFFKKTCGFTLVELLIVIIVLVILTAIAVPSYTLITNKAKETAAETEMSNIAKALEVYSSEKSTYPAEADYPDALITSGIMNAVPEKDPWEVTYVYTCNDGESYMLKSFGINKAGGGDNDIIFINGVMTEEGAYPNS